MLVPKRAVNDEKKIGNCSLKKTAHESPKKLPLKNLQNSWYLQQQQKKTSQVGSISRKRVNLIVHKQAEKLSLFKRINKSTRHIPREKIPWKMRNTLNSLWNFFAKFFWGVLKGCVKVTKNEIGILNLVKVARACWKIERNQQRKAKEKK